MSRIRKQPLLQILRTRSGVIDQDKPKKRIARRCNPIRGRTNSQGDLHHCSGRIHLSTTSREGKILILKTASAGEALGLSASVSGTGYETTAEAATPCHLSFVDRKHFLELMQEHPEISLQTAQCLSRDYQSAYRDIHDLVLTRSSAGKLARLLLSQTVPLGDDPDTDCRPTPMTHEEMAMRIGASRETVTRLISTMRRKRLIRLDGPMLVIKNRTALEALTV
jgi:CRP/FNR family cyclic AMP-dependent transcriptional regulator